VFDAPVFSKQCKQSIHAQRRPSTVTGGGREGLGKVGNELDRLTSAAPATRLAASNFRTNGQASVASQAPTMQGNGPPPRAASPVP